MTDLSLPKIKSAHIDGWWPVSTAPTTTMSAELKYTKARWQEKTRTAWWRLQSHANLSLGVNSLLTGKRTGNFVESALLTQY
jgi:hypothetical protein